MKKICGLIGIGMIVWILLLSVSGVVDAIAQETNITVFGRVIDEKGDPIKGMQVAFSATEAGNNQKYGETLSSQDGNYKFINLKPGKYSFSVNNTSDVKAIDPERHAFIGTKDSPSLNKFITLTETDKTVELNFRTALGVTVKGKITYEDGTVPVTLRNLIKDGGSVSVPPEMITLELRAEDYWGTHLQGGELNLDGSYIIKGLNAETGVITLTLKYSIFPLNINEVPSSILRAIVLPANEGDEITQNIVLSKIDRSKVSVKGSVTVAGIPYAPENKGTLEAKGIAPGTPVFIALSNPNKAFLYTTTMIMGGTYECYNLPPGKYWLVVTYELIFFSQLPPEYQAKYRKGPITGTTEIEITQDNTPVTIDINFVVSPTERVEFIRR